MSRREARIARKEAQALKDAEKSVRLKESVAALPVPRLGADPSSIFQMKMTWSKDEADCEDCWSSGTARQWSEADWNNLIEPALQEWSKLLWREIDAFASGSGHKMHHNMDTDSILEEAQLRLIDIEKHSDTIFRFRLGNKKRLWGQRNLAKFEIIWYDPHHEIYPVDPD
jgi:hypothetical protein